MRGISRGRVGSIVGHTFMILAIAGLAPLHGENVPVYLPPRAVDAVKLIGPPPTDPAELREQMAIVLWMQRTRTAAQIAFVRKSLNLERFVPILEDDLLSVDGIELKRTLDIVIDQVRSEYDAIKGRFDLPRPSEASKVVRPVPGVEVRPVPAYPSGHTIRATVYARLLADIFPDHKEQLTELAQQIGYGRVIAGAHYPADVLAGQKLGNAYADVILEQPAFKEAVARIRGK